MNLIVKLRQAAVDGSGPFDGEDAAKLVRLFEAACVAAVALPVGATQDRLSCALDGVTGHGWTRPKAGPPAQPTFWVIEGDNCYWDGRALNKTGFQGDIAAAVQFFDRNSASAVLYRLMPDFSFALRITEHSYLEQPDAKA